MTLLTTTVSVDAQRNDYNQVTINLVQGDVGTRRFMMVPISGGIPISMTEVASAKIQAVDMGGNPLLINCAIEYGKIYMEPPQALVDYQSEWQCQLVLLNESQETLHSMKFTIIVHGALFTGDTVEHTNTTVTGVEWNASTKVLTIHLADGTSLYCGPLDHTHPDATTEVKGFMTTSQVSDLETLVSRVNQELNTDSSPIFNAATIGSVTIANDGTVQGLKFT